MSSRQQIFFPTSYEWQKAVKLKTTIRTKNGINWFRTIRTGWSDACQVRQNSMNMCRRACLQEIKFTCKNKIHGIFLLNKNFSRRDHWYEGVSNQKPPWRFQRVEMDVDRFFQHYDEANVMTEVMRNRLKTIRNVVKHKTDWCRLYYRFFIVLGGYEWKL